MTTSTPSADVLTHTTMPDHFEHIFLVTGPAGCGKTTVAQALAKELKAPYIEGDDVSRYISVVVYTMLIYLQFHPAANKEKMSNNIPLNDADRWDWLITLKNEAIKQLTTSNHCIVTCSALKKKYRDVIRVANYEHPTVQIHFIFLKLDEETLQARVAQRVGHYMKKEMVHSQIMALEEPNVEEETDVIKIDVTNDKEQVEQEVRERVNAKIQEYEEVQKATQKSKPTHSGNDVQT